MEFIYKNLIASVALLFFGLPCFGQILGRDLLTANVTSNFSGEVQLPVAELSSLDVGDQVDIFALQFVFQNPPGSVRQSEFQEIYVLQNIVNGVQLQKLELPAENAGDTAMVEVEIQVQVVKHRRTRFERFLEDLPLAGEKSPAYFLEHFLKLPHLVTSDLPLIVIPTGHELPVFCQSCKTLMIEEFETQFWSGLGDCSPTVRRGNNLQDTSRFCDVHDNFYVFSRVASMIGIAILEDLIND